MANPDTVEKVREGIRTAFESATEKAPTNEQVIAAAKCSSASFYRVLEQHEDVKALLEAMRYRFGIESDGTDPIAANPHAAVKELRDVIASLVQMNAQLREQIDRQQHDIERLLAQIPGGEVTHISARKPRS